MRGAAGRKTLPGGECSRRPALDKLSFTAEAINITGEEQTSYLEFESNPMTYGVSEPRVALGLLYRM